MVQATSWAVIVLLLVLCVFGGQVGACGVTQHNAIAHKALGFLQQLSLNSSSSSSSSSTLFLPLLLSQQSAFQNGAAFPDWGYSCGGFGDESEAAHWPPFTAAYSIYVHKQCGAFNASIDAFGGWNDHCQKLAAFLFGIVSHQVADVLWHDLAAIYFTRQGFIQLMGDSDFGGSFSDAHTVADAGGEFIVAREMDLSFIEREWFLPASDLAAIYNDLQYNVTSDDISKCNEVLYAEVHSVKVGGALLYPWAADRSTFLTDKLMNYFIGGFDDNSIWTTWCWTDYLASWLSVSIESSAEPQKLCPVQATLFDDCPRCSLAEASRLSVQKHRDRIETERMHPILQEMSFEWIKSSSVETKQLISGSDQNGLVISSRVPVLPLARKPLERPSFTSQQCLYLNETNAINSTTSSVSQIIINAPSSDEFFGYLGYSLSTTDFDQDGKQDIIIGAPGAGQLGTGAVFVVKGESLQRGKGPVSSFSLPNSTTDSVIVLRGLNGHDHFGWATTSADLNCDGCPDIAISAPQTDAQSLEYKGKVFVYFGDCKGSFKSSSPLVIHSHSNWTSLGTSLVSSDINSDGFNDLLIGAPVSSYINPDDPKDEIQSGTLFVFLADPTLLPGTELVDLYNSSLILKGESEASWFGSTIKVLGNFSTSSGASSNLLFVGAPRFSSNPSDSSVADYGKIYGFSCTSRKDLQCELRATIEGIQKFDQVGSAFDVGSFASREYVLAVALSNRQKSNIDPLKKQQGLVQLFDIKSLINGPFFNSSVAVSNVSLSQLSLLSQINGLQDYSRLGWVVSIVNNKTLWISEPHAKLPSNHTKESGSLFVFNSSSTISKNMDTSDADECIVGGAERAQFGDNFVFADLNGDQSDELVVSAPRFSDTMSGAVYIFFKP